MKQQFEKKYDIVVAGAGIAGISAALAAARHGCKVCLVEKQTLIGGLATSGMIFIYLPLCDGEGHQVTFGIAEELLRAGRQYGPYELSARWGGAGNAVSDSLLNEGGECTPACAPRDRYACMFTPAGMILTLDKLLEEAGVDLWLDTRVCDALISGNRVCGITVENDSGCVRLSADRVIDASGNSCVIRFAGGAVEAGKNFNNPWFVSYDPFSKSKYSMGKPVVMQTAKESSEEKWSGMTGKEQSAFIRDSWRIARNFYDNRYQAEETSRFQSYPLTLPGMAQFRKIARIIGKETISTGEYNQYREDSIGMTGDWRHSGWIWETPYGALLPEKSGGILAAGRNIASTGDAWEAYRVIPAAAMTGEAAACAAWLSMQKNCEPAELTAEEVRQELRKNHFLFHRDEVIK